MKHRWFLGIATTACLVTWTGACRPDSPAAEPVVARNAILIVIDTLRADRPGFMGSNRPTTPRIDELARNGAVFSNAYANSPWTVPSTATIMTSLYPTEHGAEVTGDVRNLGKEPPNQMRADVATLGTILQEADVRCGLFSANPYLYGRFKDGFESALVERAPATQIVDSALGFIESAGTDRFFAHIQFMDLHQPIEPPAPYFDFFPTPDAGPRDVRHKEWSFSGGENLDTREFSDFRANRLALYDGALRYIDTEIGRLVDALADRGVLNDTLIVITSDHGEEFWDHAEIEALMGGDPRGYFGIGHGHSMFQELLHVPLVFFGHGVEAGLVVGAPTPLLDLAPTVLGCLGVAGPETMLGRDQRQTIGGAVGQRLPTISIFAESPAYGPDSWAVVEDGWKLIQRVDGVVLLFDLNGDPLETVDVALRFPDKAGEMLDRARTIRGSFVAVQNADPDALDEATVEQLRVLGYVE